MKIQRVYHISAYIIFNSLLLFILSELFFYTVYSINDHFQRSNPVYERYGADITRKVYPELNRTEVDKLIREMWSRKYTFESFTQF